MCMHDQQHNLHVTHKIVNVHKPYSTHYLITTFAAYSHGLDTCLLVGYVKQYCAHEVEVSHHKLKLVEFMCVHALSKLKRNETNLTNLTRAHRLQSSTL